MLLESTFAKEGALKISKLLKIPVLLDIQELKSLLLHLNSPSFYQLQGIQKKGEGILTSDEFIANYDRYLSFLKEGKKPAQEPAFSSALSQTSDALYSIPVEEGRHIIKAKMPIIQLQPNHIHFSSVDALFRSMVYGEDSISWGIQFSYPQLYQNRKTQDVMEVNDTFPNTSLFHRLQKWIRNETRATPFLVEGKRINAPIRLGKSCFSWIANHPELKEKGIQVYGA